MAGRIRVLIVDDIGSTLENLQKLLAFEPDIEVVGTAGNGSEAVAEAKKHNPDIVLMDVNMPVMDGIQATEALAAEAPGSPVIIMSVQGERDYLRRAMQSGAREFLIKPFSSDELIASIRRVYQLEQRKEAFIAKSSPELSVVSGDGPTEPVTRPRRTRTQGEVFMFFSGKGGVGKSVLAVNVAVSMANETRARVALVDLDLQFGDIGVLLNLDHSRGVTDLIENLDNLDEDFIRDIMVEGPGGIKVLLTPTSPELADLVTVEHIRKIFAELRKIFDFIVVDSSTHLGEINLEILEHADRVVVVSSLSIPSIKDTKLALKIFDALNLGAERVVLVLNKSDAHSEFNKEAVEANLRFPIVSQLPSDAKLVINAINRGHPFVVSNPEAEISQRVRELVGKLVPSEDAQASTDKKARRGLFARR